MCSFSHCFSSILPILSCLAPPILSFSSSLCMRTLVHTRTQNTQPWKTQSAVWARGLANELSYWNRKESALCCRKCCYGKLYRRGTDRKLLVRTKKHEKVLSPQMYQLACRRSRLHPFLPRFFSFLFFFFYHSHLIIIHKTPLSAVSAVRGNKLPIQKMYFSSLIRRSFLSS